MGVLCVLFVILVVPLLEIVPSPEFFARPGTISIAIFSGPIFYKRLSKRLKTPPVPIRQNYLDGIWIWGLLYFTGNIGAVLYTILFWDMNGGGAMYPTIFLLWGFLGIPLAMVLGGFTGWVSHKLTLSGV